MSAAQASEKLSIASTSTGRGPSRDHSAISTAPVSEAGTMPSFQSAGMPSSACDCAITSPSRARGPAARWLRPSRAPDSAARVKPGRFAQGPEPKFGLRGRSDGRGDGMDLNSSLACGFYVLMFGLATRTRTWRP